MSQPSQVSCAGGPHPKSWDDFEQDCLATYGGGYRNAAEREIFHHGMTTVFNLLRCEFPPAEMCKTAPDLLTALKDLLCFATPGGLHGTEPDEWSTQGKAVCSAARAAIKAAEGGAT